MKRKLLISALCLIVMFSLALTLTACDGKQAKASTIDMEFKLNDDGKSYSLINVKEADKKEFSQVKIPETYKNLPVTEIGDYAFFFCYSVIDVEIPDSVTKIGKFAFGFCRSLSSVNIPQGITEICEDAFSHCSSLTNITLPNKVTEIKKFTFHGCSSLKKITISSNINSIGDIAFSGCNSLESISYNGNENDWKSISIGLFGNDKLKTLVINYNR